MLRSGWTAIVLLVLCASVPCFVSYGVRQAAHGHMRMIDFGDLYYGARCALHRQDPYDPSRMLQVFQAEGGTFMPDSATTKIDRIVITRVVYLPTGLFCAIPFALLPWWIAQNVWMILTAALLVIAALLVRDLGAGEAPLLWASLAGCMLFQSSLIAGNVAGIAVGFCTIAVWCFLKERYAWAGVLLLAASLVIKPHDSGFVWLYFLLAGGTMRKRALQTLAVTAVLALCSVLWLQPISPHWMSELHHNISFETTRGSIDDPGPTGLSSPGIAESINLQAVLSFFRDDPNFYNPASFLICGVLIFVWGLKTWRNRFSMESARLALAAIAALSLLPVYHRPYDAALLLLALPACAMLWKEPGPRRWFALGLTTGGILLTGTIPLVLLARNKHALAAFAARFPGRLPTVLALRPTPFVLLAMGCFYLWLYLRYEPEQYGVVPENGTAAASRPVSEPAG